MPMPDEIDVYFADRTPPIRCRSLKEVDKALDTLHREVDPTKCPLAVSIRVFGHEVWTGLGVDQSFVCINIEPCDGEFYLTVGEQPAGEAKMFWGASQDSYWNPENMIPYEKARAAVRYFVRHQRRDPSVRWQDWEGRSV